VSTTLPTVRLAAAAVATLVVAAPSWPGGPSPAFTGAVSKVRWSDLRFSYRAGCPVGPRDLRTLRLSYWDFDGRARVGRLVVHRRVSRDVVAVFRRLYAARFPIRRMAPVSRYRGSDDASMAADNTSGFNCRFVSGTSRWSMHAFGLAIDVNPVENPYISGGRVSPPAGRRYLDRARAGAGMAVTGGALVNAFAAVGWRWGGHWSGAADYQHFSTNGR
jgi:D-alanyl-D-alanine carboxypeptidase